MSIENQEKENTEETTEQTDGAKVETDLINTNVALLKADNVNYMKRIASLEELVTDLTKRLKQATDLIEDDTKHRLLADIKPRVEIPDELLVLKSLNELKAMKRTLDVARIPAFKSGTPLVYSDKKPSARQSLDDVNKDFMAKLRGAS